MPRLKPNEAQVAKAAKRLQRINSIRPLCEWDTEPPSAKATIMRQEYLRLMKLQELYELKYGRTK